VENSTFPYNRVMKEKEIRFRVPNTLYKNYKLLCIELDLSIPKQTAALIKAFVETQEHNIKMLKEARKE